MKILMIPCLLFLFVFISCKKGGGNGEPPPPVDNVPPKITIEDLSLFEGNGGTTIFNVQVRLSKAWKQPVSVSYSTQDGTAKSPADYKAVINQVLSFTPEETTKNIAIEVVADDIREGNEEFTINLSNSVNATIEKAAAKIIIRNDDTKIVFSDAGYDAPTSYAGYTLVWEDDFTSSSLNTAYWTVEGGDGCPSMCGWGNNELEYYTNRPENLFFQDGKMIIEARAENYSGRNYTSSKIVSRGKKTFKFGRIDMRAKLPIGKGIWPAFWMMPQEDKYGIWPTSGEIDIMEMVGHQAGTTHGTIHFGPGPGSTQKTQSKSLASGSLNDEFHVYSLEWKEDEIKWFLDGVEFGNAKRADLNLGGAPYPFNEEFFFIFNLAVGGNWPGSPDTSTVFPQWFIVDYVRVYQQ